MSNGCKALPPANRESARQTLGLGDDSICIGFVGRISLQKSVDRLVRSFAPLCKDLPGLRMAIVGDGPELANVKAIAESLGVIEQIIFTGTADGVTLMAGFDIFALCSRYEGFPYVLIEAVARGLPILTTDIGGARDVVEPGRNGHIVSQEAPQKLTEHARVLCENPEIRIEMGMQSREIAKRFTVDEMVRETVDIYRATIARRSCQ